MSYEGNDLRRGFYPAAGNRLVEIKMRFASDKWMERKDWRKVVNWKKGVP